MSRSNITVVTPGNAADILRELRLCEDMTFVEPVFGDHVWLRRCEGGITDCCLVEAPCDHHARLTHPAQSTNH